MKKLFLFTTLLILSFSAKAQDNFIGEIRIFAGNFAPKGWAFCDGQIMPISQNTALFSLLGTMYGGDGKSTFALPNLNGKVPIGMGQGSGLSYYDEGQEGGQDNVTLMSSEMPAHAHTVTAGTVAIPGYSGTGNTDSPENSYPANSTKSYSATTSGNMSSTANAVQLSVAGGNQPHNNLQPYLVVRYIIALQGIYPPRS
jgi:microcystin-dependent protein